MKNSKIITIVRTLSKDELKSLEQFICSPIHNKHNDVIRLFKYFKKNIDSERKLDKERIFKYLFPKETFKMQRVHYVNSYFLKVLEDFLAWHEWKKDTVSQQIYLVQSYNKHLLGNQLQKSFQNGIQLLEENPLKNSNYFWQLYQLNFRQINYHHTLGRKVKLNLQELTETLDISFIVEKLKSSCALANAQTMSKNTYDTGLLDAIFDFIEKKELLKIPAVAIYFHAYQALLNNDDLDSFYELKRHLVEHEKKFTVSELRDIYVMALNFCIKRWNKGDHELMSQILDLYKTGLKAKVFLENGILSRLTYNNIIIAGLRRKEYDWVREFIEDYASLLSPNHREGSYNFNFAKYYYEIGNYEQAMQLLQKMEYDDLLHNMGAKIMLAKMYYELEEVDTLDNLLKSARIYMHRKKMLGYHREVYENIFGFIKKLTNLNPFDKKARTTLKTEIQNTKVLTEKDWLLLQLDKME